MQDKNFELKNRIWDKFWRAKMSVCIIWKHNHWGWIDHYIIQKKDDRWRHRRKTVKVMNSFDQCVDLEFQTKDDALKRLDENSAETMCVFHEIDFIIA